MAQAGTQTTEDSHNGDGGGGVARATITTLASASAPALTGAMEENSTSSGSSGVGEQEKRVLERAWDLYLQVSGHGIKTICGDKYLAQLATISRIIRLWGKSYSDMGH